MRLPPSLPQLLIMATLLISLFGCFKKKEMKPDLNAWLETNFPGQLVAVEDIIDLNPKNLFTKKKSTIVGDKNDPAIQFTIDWNKAEPDLGIKKEEVQAALEKSIKEAKEARNFFSALKSGGLDLFSVGVIDRAAYILVYEEPTPVFRQETLEKILSTIDQLPTHDQTSIWIECMEPGVYKERFNDIIPLGYWQQAGTYRDDKKIISLDFEWSPGLNADILNTKWTINDRSERTALYRKEAYRVALEWATKNLPKPFYLEPDQMTGIEVDSADPLALLFYFPYYTEKPDTSETGYYNDALGNIIGSYQTDQKTFTKIKNAKTGE